MKRSRVVDHLLVVSSVTSADVVCVLLMTVFRLSLIGVRSVFNFNHVSDDLCLFVLLLLEFGN